MIMMTTIMTIA